MDKPHLVIAARIVSDFEGFRSAPYLCSAGRWTIGYGTTVINGQPVTRDTPPVTEAGARLLLQGTLLSSDEEVGRLVKVPLNDNQRAALISFVYNFGGPKFTNSTLRSLLNRGKYLEAADQFDLWVNERDPATGQLRRSNGLVRRRRLEKELFLKQPE